MPPLKSGRSRLAIGCAVVAMATAVTGPAWADPAPSFEALLERIGLTPTTVEAGALLDAAEARVRQARVRPNPELGLEAENAFGSGPFSGYDNAETTLSLTQDLELWGRRGARVEVARADAGTAGLRRDLATVEAGARLALVYAEAEAAQRRFLLAEEALTVTIADTRAALILVEEGREPLLRGIQGESEAAAARAPVERYYAGLTRFQLDAPDWASDGKPTTARAFFKPGERPAEFGLRRLGFRDYQSVIEVEHTRARLVEACRLGLRSIKADGYSWRALQRVRRCSAAARAAAGPGSAARRPCFNGSAADRRRRVRLGGDQSRHGRFNGSAADRRRRAPARAR